MEQKNQKFHLLKPIVAMLFLISAITLACGGSASTPLDNSFTYVVRVQDEETKQNISNAKVTIEVAGQAPLDEITDTNGVARPTIAVAYANKPGRLLIEADKYEPYRQEINIIEGALPDTILLKPVPNKPTPISTIAPTPTTAQTFTPESTFTNTPQLSPTEDATIPTTVESQVSEVAIISPDSATGEFVINQPIITEPANFTVTLKTITILSDGTMSWNFEFWNKTETKNDLYFNQNSYVVDDLGNRYGVVKELSISPQAGERMTQSVEFEAPKPGATVFTLYWGGQFGVQFKNPVISVSAALNPAPTPQPTPPPAGTISINQAIQVDPSDFLVNLISIQLLPTKTMSWNFEFWNKTRTKNDLYFNQNSYVVQHFPI